MLLNLASVKTGMKGVVFFYVREIELDKKSESVARMCMVKMLVNSFLYQ